MQNGMITELLERGFASRSFSYIAPCLYNKLPITIKLIDSLYTYKSHFNPSNPV